MGLTKSLVFELTQLPFLGMEKAQKTRILPAVLGVEVLLVEC